MPPPDNSGIRDKHLRGLVAKFHQFRIKDGSRLSIVSAYFTIYTHDKLKH